MFGSIIQFVDSLFWETRIVTTTTTIYHITKKTDDNREGKFRLMTNDFTAPVVAVPADVLDAAHLALESMPPLYRNGKIDHLAFAQYRNAPVIACLTDARGKFSSVDGMTLSRSAEIQGWTRKKAFIEASRCEEICHRGRVVNMMSSIVGGMTLTSTVSDNWVFFTLRQSDSFHIRLYQANVGQYTDPVERVVMAKAIARAFLITLDQNDYLIDAELFVNEDDLQEALRQLMFRPALHHAA